MKEEINDGPFQVGKTYRHTSGSEIFICGAVQSWAYGLCLLAETKGGNFIAVGKDKTNSVNYREVPPWIEPK